MGVVSADQEQQYGDCEQKLLCRSVLVAAIDLFPHVQVVVCSCVELKRYTPDPVEHEE